LTGLGPAEAKRVSETCGNTQTLEFATSIFTLHSNPEAFIEKQIQIRQADG
jgi:hypothetical protein